MISRITIFSLLLGLLLGLGIVMYSQGERDRCAAYPAGGVAPRSEFVVTGNREVEVPCSEWFLRQPLAVQTLSIVDGLIGAIFLLNALADLSRWAQAPRPRKAG